jgi:hypothetical protein
MSLLYCKYSLMRPPCGAFVLQYSVEVEAFEGAVRRYVKGPVKPSAGTDTSALRASSKIEAEDRHSNLPHPLIL